MLAMVQAVLVLAHCGAKWWLCDGVTSVGAVGIVGGIWWSARRADKKQKEREAAVNVSRVLDEIREKQEASRR
jgi:hypothetical protein